MNRVVFWTGPVNLQQVQGATVPGARLLNIPCTGNGTPTCGQLADGWSGVIPGTVPSDELFIGAFSAGGSAVKRLAMQSSFRAQTRAVMLADAMYTPWASPGKPEPPEGFVLYGLDAIDPSKQRMMVATVSDTPNISTQAPVGQVLPSGSQTMAAVRAEIERRSGRDFVEVSVLGVTPAPVKAWRLGNVLLADYGSTVPHGGQAALAKEYWQKVLVPWLDGGAVPVPGPTPEEPWWPKAVALAAGAAAGYAGTRWASKYV